VGEGNGHRAACHFDITLHTPVTAVPINLIRSAANHAIAA
jgi:hypothetical protein